MSTTTIVAIDGPSASGKSSTAREVATRLGLVHLNSGVLYRTATWIALRDGWSIDTDVSKRIHSLRVTFELDSDVLELRVNGEPSGDWLHADEVTARVSDVAEDGTVRKWANEALREAALTTGLVVDGRDIGTVVFPGALLKIFLTASAEVRARRRLLQREVDTTPDAVAREASRLRERDRRDSSRILAPLSRAEDAVEIDTTNRDPEEVVQEIVGIYRARNGTPD